MTKHGFAQRSDVAVIVDPDLFIERVGQHRVERDQRPGMEQPWRNEPRAIADEIAGDVKPDPDQRRRALRLAAMVPARSSSTSDTASVITNTPTEKGSVPAEGGMTL